LSLGNYHTGFTASRLTTANSDANSVFQGTFRGALGVMEKDELNAPEPVKVAQVLERAITANRPRKRYIVDPTFFRFVPMLKRLLPYALIEYAHKRLFKLT
jgi:hypothetical protein